jgi:hypothetical protein
MANNVEIIIKGDSSSSVAAVGALNQALAGLGARLPVLGAVELAFQSIKSVFETVTGIIAGLFESRWGWLLPGGSLASGLLGLQETWDTVWSGISARTGEIWNGIQSTVKGGINYLIGAINAFIDGVNRIKISVPGVDLPLGQRIPGFEVGLPPIARIPALAAGGDVRRGGLALVGERGPELVALPRGAQVTPLAGDGAAPISVFNDFVGATIVGIDDLEERIQASVRRALRQAGTRR